MAKAQYPSISTPSIKQLGPQYITEILLSRQEAKNNRRLAERFWSSTKEWKKRYRTSLLFVRKFLKNHSEEAVIAALLSGEGKNIAYLQDKRLVALVEKEANRIEQMQNLDNVMEPVERPDEPKTMTKFQKKNTLSKLRELDG